MKKKATLIVAATLSTALLAATTTVSSGNTPTPQTGAITPNLPVNISTSGSSTAATQATSGSSSVSAPSATAQNVQTGKIASIVVQGNSSITTAQIMAKLPFAVGATFNKALVKQGATDLQNSGWFKSVTPSVVEYQGQVYVTYAVVENPMINQIIISGNDYVSTQDILSAIPIKPYSMFDQGQIQETVQDIQALYQKAGYFVEIKDISLDPMYNLNITLLVPTLNAVEFKKVVTKDSPSKTFRTKQYVMQRQVDMPIGQPIKYADVQNTIANLYQLGIVQPENPEFKPVKGNPNAVDVVFPVQEKRTGQLMGSVSYGTAIGVVGTFSILDNNFNGMDQTLGLSLQASTQDNRTYMLQFSDPWIKGTNHVNFNSSLFKTDYLAVNGPYTSSYGASFGFGRSFAKHWNLTINNSLTNYAQFSQNNYSALLDSYTAYTIGPQLTYDTRNNVLNPTSGDYDYLNLTQGFVFGGHGDIQYPNPPMPGQPTIDYGNLAGGPQYQTASITLTKYVPFLFNSNFLAARSIVGTESSTTPNAALWQVGGDGTLRGYDPGTFQGTQEVVLNVENRYNVASWFQTVAFFDTGTATNSVSNMLALYSDYGVGFRIFSPLGPLRFDFAWPLRTAQGSGGGLHFIFGVGEMF